MGGGVVAIYANIIVKSSNTASGAIQANGGNGGNGGTGTAGSVGGGAGGGAGGGGWIYMAYNYIAGPAITNFLQVNGGMGGIGGNGYAVPLPTISGGSGGAGGNGGRITLFNISTLVGSERYGDISTSYSANPEVTTGLLPDTAFGNLGGDGGNAGLCGVTI